MPIMLTYEKLKLFKFSLVLICIYPHTLEAE